MADLLPDRDVSRARTLLRVSEQELNMARNARRLVEIEEVDVPAVHAGSEKIQASRGRIEQEIPGEGRLVELRRAERRAELDVQEHGQRVRLLELEVEKGRIAINTVAAREAIAALRQSLDSLEPKE